MTIIVALVDPPATILRKAGFKLTTKVKSLWPNARPLIALHSPSALLETGLGILDAQS
jgi:hypothetical protein